jgi:hypothetical protein
MRSIGNIRVSPKRSGNKAQETAQETRANHKEQHYAHEYAELNEEPTDRQTHHARGFPAQVLPQQ